MQERDNAPAAIMALRHVDGGRAAIGSIDCPHCGKEHLTIQIRCGKLRVFCGKESVNPDGWSWVDIQTIT